MSTSLPVQTLGEIVKIGEGFAAVELASTILLNADKVVALGTDNTDGAQLTGGVSVVTGADATVGVMLPQTPKVGEICIVLNSDESNALEIYPGTSGFINGSNVNLGHTTPAMSISVAIALSPLQWYMGEIVVSVA